MTGFMDPIPQDAGFPIGSFGNDGKGALDPRSKAYGGGGDRDKAESSPGSRLRPIHGRRLGARVLRA